MPESTPDIRLVIDKVERSRSLLKEKRNGQGASGDAEHFPSTAPIGLWKQIRPDSNIGSDLQFTEWTQGDDYRTLAPPPSYVMRRCYCGTTMVPTEDGAIPRRLPIPLCW